jgi:ribosomal protein L15
MPKPKGDCFMFTKVQDKAACQIVQGQRVKSGHRSGNDGIIIAIHGKQSPSTIGKLGGFMNYGGSAYFDVAFPDHISRRVPESVVRDWDIYESIATADEILDAIAQANAQQELAKLQEQVKAERHELERQEFRKDPKYAHLVKVGERERCSGGKLVAVNIRTELKRHFPKVKFRVTSDYNSVNVKWENGPSPAKVKEITDKYQLGNFDGMQDMYVSSDEDSFNKVFGGCKYVFETREVSIENKRKAFKEQYPNGITIDGQTYLEYVDNNKDYHTFAWMYRTWSEKDFA